MMERLLKPADVAARYGVTVKTARAYMKKMVHQENPLTVTENAVAAWDAKRTVDPDARPAKRAKKAPMPVYTGRVPRYKEVFGSTRA